MNILTKYLGELTIDKQEIITFPNGLPGFIEEKEFILIDLPNNPLFQFLQSVNNAELAFIVTNPYNYYETYTFELDEQTLTNLKISRKQDVDVKTIVTLQEPFIHSTLNLKAPLIINRTRRLAKQYILQTNKYQTKSPINVMKGE